MVAYFYNEDEIKLLTEDYDNLYKLCSEMQNKIYEIMSNNEEINNIIKNGYNRRLTLLVRCITNIFEIHFPSAGQSKPIDFVDSLDITINLQTFYINLYGCFDNLAQIFVKIRNIQGLRRNEISLFNECFRKKLSKKIINYCDNNMKEWLEKYMPDTRHSIAHRLPIYVPISIEYTELNQHFFPNISMHHLNKDKSIAFHAQIICDIKTLHKFSILFIDELKNSST